MFDEMTERELVLETPLDLDATLFVPVLRWGNVPQLRFSILNSVYDFVPHLKFS